MPSDPASNRPPAPASIPVRRRDRAVADEAWLERFLAHASVGVLALPPVRAGEPPHLNSNLFAWDAAAREVVLHSAHVGALATRVADHHLPASFTCFAMGRVLPDARALEFSVEYAGVTVQGPLRRVTDAAEAAASLQLLMDRIAPHLRPERDYEPATDADLRRTAVYRLRVERWSGKRKVAADDHPGAFELPSWDGWRAEVDAGVDDD